MKKEQEMPYRDRPNWHNFPYGIMLVFQMQTEVSELSTKANDYFIDTTPMI